MPVAKKANTPAGPQPGNQIISIASTKRANEIAELTSRRDHAIENFERGAIGMSGQRRDADHSAMIEQAIAALEDQIIEIHELDGPALCDRYVPDWRPVESVPFSEAVNRGRLAGNYQPQTRLFS